MSEIQLSFEDLERLARSDGWVQGLARRLVGDASLAEDVVQEAYLVALSSEARPRGSFSAWLSGVVRNVAHSRLREDSRRRSREAKSARAEAVGATDESVARLEQQGLLIRQLLDLPEPYREALILRYVEGLAPRHMAKRLAVPVATVNSRLARGLERMRAQLDASADGDRSRWMAAFAPLLVSPSKLSPWTLGGLFVNYKLLTAATLVMAFFIGRELFDGSAGSTPIEHGGVEQVESLAAVTQPEVVRELAAGDGARTLVEIEAAGVPEVKAGPIHEMTFVLRDASTREALPGAKLYLVHSDEFYGAALDMQEFRNHLPGLMRERMRELGGDHSADDRGRVVVSAPDGQLLLLAEHGDLRVADYSRAAAEETTLYLGPDHPLTVRVLDGQGVVRRGVPVMLACQASGGGDETFLLPISTDSTAESDGFAHLLMTQEGSRWAEDMDLVVALALPLAKPVTVTLDPTDLPTETVDLILPDVGEVEVTVRHAGEPAPDGTRVLLAEAGNPTRVDVLFGGSVLSGKTEDGRVVIGPVGLGAEFLVGSWAPDSPDVEFVAFPGPGVAGQRVQAVLELHRVVTRLTGRVLDAESGMPPADALIVQRADLVGGTLEVDDEGRFEVTFGLSPTENELRLLRYGPTGPVTDTVVLPLVREDSLDLGTIELTPLAQPAAPEGPAVTGIVIDAEGQPVRSAVVRWVTRYEKSGAWVPTGSAAHTSKEGRFTLPGELPAPEACLEVQSSRGWIEPVPAAVPSSDLVLQLQAGATLTGRLELDEGVSAKSVALGVWEDRQGPAPERLDVFGWASTTLQGSEFRIEGLRPGSYTFRLEPDGHRDAAVVLTGIEVRDQSSRDARLDPLDLRGQLTAFRLRVFDEEGNVLTASVYAIRDRTPVYVGHTERTPFVTSVDPPTAYVVEKDGYFPVALDPLDMPERVVLERGIEVPFEWKGQGGVEDLPFRLKLELVPVEALEVIGGSSTAYFMRNVSPAQAYLGEGESPRVRVEGTYALRVRSSLEEPEGYFWGQELSVPGLEMVMVRKGISPIAIALGEETIEAEARRLKESMGR